MQIGRRGIVGASIALVASGIGLGELARKLAPRFSRSIPTQTPIQPDTKALEQAVQMYNSSSLEERSRILNAMYGGRAKLVPITYDNGYEMLHEFYQFAEDYVQAGVSFGELQVRGTTFAEAGFTLDYRNIHVTMDQQGKLKPGGGMIRSGNHFITIPKGYSLLVVDEGSNVMRIEMLLEGLSRFASQHPDVGIDDAKIDIIKNGLKDLGYMTPIR